MEVALTSHHRTASETVLKHTQTGEGQCELGGLEWNGGLDYWSGVLDWITGAPRPQMHNLVYLP